MSKNKYPGVYENKSSISMIFSYYGKQIKKTYKIPPNKRNLMYVYNEKVKIQELIERGDFDLDDFYANSKKSSTSLRAKRYTFDEMYSEFVQSYASEKAPSTMASYNSLAKEISLAVGNRPMGSISPSELRKILKKNYKNRNNKSLSEMINVWRRAHVILSQKVKNIRYQTSEYQGLKKCTTPPDPFKKKEVFAIYDNLDSFDQNSLPLALAIFTGLRPGELASLALEDIDMKATPPTLAVRRSLSDGGIYKLPKSRTSFRIVELSLFAVKVIDRILPEVKDELTTIYILQEDYNTKTIDKVTFLFRTSTGKVYRYPSHLNRKIAASFKKDLNFLNIDYKPLQKGRQSFATFCLELGATFMSVAKELGHRDQRVLEEHYSSSKHAEPTHKILNARYNQRKSSGF
ncbi:Arm DNA-binding domain-containing protein [Vibrio coralliirubri]|uniref:Arm DNA-binding domain-containing protein n=1 Tax=Vibrio coralliirubri TaxID=1516159 RepID=UPI00076A5C6E|nr:DUF3596 domain-containing protein [Vibrio coralliirubri]